LNGLLSLAKSQTLADLIVRAKIETEKSLEKLVEIQKVSILYLKKHDLEAKERRNELKGFLVSNTEKFKEPDRSILSINLKSEVLNMYSSKVELESNVYSLGFDVIGYACDEFQNALLASIFKPDESEFQYERILETLNYIASKIFHGLDEMKLIGNLLVPNAKRRFAKSGDKTLEYLEKYIEVLEKWQSLGNSYIQMIEK